MTTAPTPTRVSAPARILMAPVHAWRVVSSRLPQRCRFHPSCSAYALGALETHGAARGTWLALRRLGRCHPWHPGGIDAVPLRTGNTRSPVESMQPRPRPSEGRQ